MIVTKPPVIEKQKGSVVLEALIAILIFSLGILALVGLQAAMISNTTDSNNRTEATFVAQQILGRIWTYDHQNIADIVEILNNDESISATLPNGTHEVEAQIGGVVNVTITWQPKGQDELSRYTTSARIAGG